MTAHHAFSLARIVKNACLRVLFYQTVMLFIRLIRAFAALSVIDCCVDALKTT